MGFNNKNRKRSNWRKILTSKANGLLFIAGLLVAVQTVPAALVSANSQSSSSVKSFEEVAAACSPDTLTQVGVAGGDMTYDTLYSERKEDHPRLNKICGIVKKFAAAGKPVEPFDPTPVTFFHGLELSFVEKYYASVFIHTGGIYLESSDRFLKLADSDAIEVYNSFFVLTEFLTVTPESPRFGEKIRLKGHHPSFFAESVHVFWIPEKPSYISSSKLENSAYPSQSALLLYEGKQQFGYYDFTFSLPAFGKAADGSMQPLGRRGSIEVNRGAGRGAYNRLDSIVELLPSKKPFLSVNGVISDSADLKPLLREGRAMLPLRSVSKLAGKSVVWDSSTWSVLIRSKPPEKSESTYLYPKLWIDGRQAPPELQPILIDGVTFVPIRALTAAFGISVAWDNVSKSAFIEV